MLTYKLYTGAGELIEEAREPITYLHGGHHGIFPKIEDELSEMEPGDSCSVTLEPEDAFGDYDEQKVFLEPRPVFPQDLEEGMTFEGLPAGATSGDAPRNLLYTVTEIYPDNVVLDGNHPLAGIALRLHLKVEAVREATEEEVGRGTLGTGFFRIGDAQ